MRPLSAARHESQRDSGPEPRVASSELPWDRDGGEYNPAGVAATREPSTPTSQPQPRWGCWRVSMFSQGSSLTRNPGLEDAIPLGLKIPVRSSADGRTPLNSYSGREGWGEEALLSSDRRFMGRVSGKQILRFEPLNPGAFGASGWLT